MVRRLTSVAAMFVLLSMAATAQERDSLHYRIQLRSGDAFRCNLIGYTDSTLTVQTEFGSVTLRKALVARFIAIDGPYRRRPNHFLMPTASPNPTGGFVTDYELGFLYAGIGVADLVSLSAGATLVPTLAIGSQLLHLNLKVTVERNTDFELALGGSYTFLTSDFPYLHLYAVGTFPIGTGRYSAMVFYRAKGLETANIRLQLFNLDTTEVAVHYEGSLGAALGFDAPAFGRDDITWVGEIWNNDLLKPQNTVSMLGIRLTNEHLSADFGLALFSAPLVVPVTSFTWRF